MEDKTVKRYYQLKKKQKEIELELAELRGEIVRHCVEGEINELEIGNYKVKVIAQERKEFDEAKLFAALPDPEVWRLLSKPDTSKIAGLIKLNVISEETIKDTYSVKHLSLLQVDKK
ncbi:hypothetical protein [Paenibacillus glycanilyticus]|uniref:Transcription elongation factor GreA/GreB C-terminal domain-containing protein n=1 Tax=Paenibacillus glycanilyticus TaxID=126569 RepID=A0ABQ6GGQ0_9BACL|nr:hypothetical protein [Paenibacillus glycanilyticus]GLX68781.1 hypothetical protein MU1_31260 [Paenibacillus glycanilyticus]